MNLTPVHINIFIYLFLFGGLFFVNPAISESGITERISVPSSEAQVSVGGAGAFADTSPNGRYVTFSSGAPDLVPNDTNSNTDVFFHDRKTGITELVSVSSYGAQGNGRSVFSSISADGRYITFISDSTNFEENDTTTYDVFVHDRVTHTTEKVSKAFDGTLANNSSDYCGISDNGRYIVYSSKASNLVPGDTNGGIDLFVFDRITHTTKRVNVASDGTQGKGGILVNNSSRVGMISADGRYIAFTTGDDSLVPDDTNDKRDSFVHDQATGITERVNVASDGSESRVSVHVSTISANGRYVAFTSNGTDLVPGNDSNTFWDDIFVHDRVTGENERVSVSNDGIQANRWSDHALLSDDGRFVIFTSISSNLVPGVVGQQVYLRDRTAGITEVMSIASEGTPGNAWSHPDAVSFDGRYVYFTSLADNFVVGDTNGAVDVFVHDRLGGNTPPTAFAGDPQTVTVGDLVQLSGSGQDTENDPLTFSWTVDSAPEPVVLTNADTAIPEFVPNTAGDYTFTLIVNDGALDSAPSSVTITVISAADAAKDAVIELGNEIADINTDILKNANQKNALTNKVNAVLDLIAQNEYQLALDKLQNDILGKTNGCVDINGNPDKNDWVKDCNVQIPLQDIISDAIYYLQKALGLI